jgi:BCCT, betaine/carnitine/choline family transporter
VFSSFPFDTQFSRHRISWSGFVGLLIARISRGRTLGELILHSLIIPIIVCLVWFSIWGGIGLRQSRQGMELEALGGTYFNNTGHFLAHESEFCYDVPQEDIVVNGEVIFTNHLPGITPVCQFDSTKAGTASFNVLHSFSFPESFTGGGYGPPLSVIYIIALTLFFVTSSDSGSLIVDHLSSNGCKSHHWIRRMFWAITQGALATALLSSGGNTALKAVQAASIVCGLPYVILLLFTVQCIHLLCRAADKLQNDEEYEFPDQPEFETPLYGGMFNIMEFLSSLGRVNKARVELGIHRPTTTHLKEFIKGVFVPFISLHQIISALHPTMSNSLNIIMVFTYAVSYYGWIAMFFTSWSYPSLEAWSVTFLVISGAILGKIRSNYRYKYNIRSNIVADFLAGLLLWPQALTQMRLFFVSLRQNKMDDDELPKPWNAEISDSSQSLPSS